MKTTIAICFVALALIARQAEAKVAPIEFRDMIEKADMIVIGTVDSVGPVKGEPSRAHLKIIEVLKGKSGEQIDVYVNKTWTCDASKATRGERILLFTAKDSRTGRYRIYRAGRGRMPIVTVNGTDYATLWRDVLMPSSIRITDGSEPRSNPNRQVDLADLKDLKAYIEKVLKESFGKNAGNGKEKS